MMLTKAVSLSVAQPDSEQPPTRLASFRAPATLLHVLSDAHALKGDGAADAAGFVDVTYRCATVAPQCLTQCARNTRALRLPWPLCTPTVVRAASSLINCLLGGWVGVRACTGCFVCHAHSAARQLAVPVLPSASAAPAKECRRC